MGLCQLIFPVQALCLSLTVSGMSTAISRFAAGKSALGDEKGARDLFFTGTGFSFLFSCLISWVLRENAGTAAEFFLQDPRTVPLLRLVSWILPLSALHACVNAYFYSREKTALPAAGQLLEQSLRIVTACAACAFLLSRGETPTAWVAVIGMFAGEFCAVIFCLFYFLWRHPWTTLPLFPVRTPFLHLKNLFTVYLPLTASRLITTLLSSAEAIFIPSRLIRYGCSSPEALGTYGTLTGMALPLILFPTAFTNSFSVMLLPSIAQLQALEQEKKIRHAVELTVQCCLLLGFSCMVCFTVFGDFLGNFLFHSSQAGSFIRILSFVCPFLYLNAALASVLNGLGKTNLCLIHSVLGITLRLACVLWVIPVRGIQGYLWGILISEACLTLLHLSALNRLLSFDLHLLSPGALCRCLRSR